MSTRKRSVIEVLRLIDPCALNKFVYRQGGVYVPSYLKAMMLLLLWESPRGIIRNRCCRNQLACSDPV